MMPRLAFADMRHEWQMFLCYAIALAAVLAPLMVLYGLKYGVVTSLTSQLLADPANREILVIGNRDYERDWLADLSERPEVGFLMPRTRSIAATLYTSAEVGGRTGLELAELVPSGPGDPLLPPGTPPLQGHRVAISHALAQALDVAAGATIGGTAIRQIGDARQRVDLPLEVAAVLPQRAFQRKAVLAPLDLLEAVEDYRDGLAVPRYGWEGEAGNRSDGGRARSYASFRIYASSLEAVGPLVDHLTAQGIEVRSQVAEIEAVQRLDSSLGHIFTIVAGLGGIGYLLALGASLWSNVERKQRDLSVIRFLGLSSADLVRFPMLQAFGVATGGLVMAFGLYLAAESVINAVFAVPTLEGQAVCVLQPVHYLIAAGATLAAAAVASALAGWRASLIEPAEGMRNV